MQAAIAYALIRKNSHPHHDGLRWEPGRDGHIPENAVPVGHLGGQGGELMYVGRVHFPTTDIIPGTVVPGQKCCYVAFNKQVLAVNEYEVLVNYKPQTCQLHWEHAKRGHTPQGAVKGGYDATTGGIFYIARGRPDQSVHGTHCGKVEHTSALYDEEQGGGYAYIADPYDSTEHALKEYEVLCQQFVEPFQPPL